MKNIKRRSAGAALVFAFVLLLFTTQTSNMFAQSTAILPDPDQTGWQASYWNNTTLSGAPTLIRQELTLNYDWGFRAPGPQVENDSFSARWVKSETLPEGTYRFSGIADDGIRVWINDIQIIDAWELAGQQTVSAEIYLDAGTYETRVEYVEYGGIASIRFDREFVNDDDSADSLNEADNPNNDSSDDSDAQDNNDNLMWRSEYFNNPTLTGTPALVRDENNIDFGWGTGSPADGIVDPERFSARWTQTLDLAPARYRFAVTADDGIRLFVNDQLLIDRWREQSVATYTAEADLEGGPTEIRIEYFEVAGKATARFSYAEVEIEEEISIPVISVPLQSGQWRGEYFDNVNLSGVPALVRTDDAIDFNWSTGSPADELGVDRFSVRWTGRLELTPGRYRFETTVDDGVRLRINGQTLIDEFVVRSATQYVTEIDLPTGLAATTMEYFENTERAVARLEWRRIGDVSTVESASNLPSDQPVAVVANVNTLNVRSGPSTNFDRIDRLVRNQTVEMVGRNRTETWIQITLPDGRIGWVSRQYLDSNFPIRSLRETG